MNLLRSWCGRGCAALCLVAACTAPAAPVPVVYSTDLMHPHVDPDDHFDLACLYAIPEADLRAIILDQGDRQVQHPGFKAVWQLNYLSGRHVPAAIGLRDKLKHPGDPALDQPAEHQNGVHLLLQTLQTARDPVAILFVGSARDVVAAYNRQPALFRDKVRSIHGFIGDAGDPTHQEWNVKLDPQAFVGILRADLPFFWIPCFDGGVWTNRGHASFWRIRHGDVLERASAPLQRYILYMLRQATEDPITYLSQPTSPEDRAWLMAGPRNLWCGALLGLAVGHRLLDHGQEVAGFAPVEVFVDNAAVIRYGPAPGSRTVMRFEIKDQACFAGAVTRATARLLESFPVRRAP
ncbi:MAG: nucleoside hydrolase [Verrucomicrobia bacterium]|nr:nucleoside hydrolase [Verrucomicrobiota bacterium]